MDTTAQRLIALRKSGISPRIRRLAMAAEVAQADAERCLQHAKQALAALTTALAAVPKPVVPAEGPKLDKRGWIISGRIRPEFRRSHDLPHRVAVRYNKAENDALLQAWADGKGRTLAQIAQTHQRTINGVRIQLCRLGAKGLEN